MLDCRFAISVLAAGLLAILLGLWASVVAQQGRDGPLGLAFPDPGRPAPQERVPDPLSSSVRRAAGKRIRKVRIVGNETVGDEKVLSHLRTRRGREFDPEIVQADKRRLVTTGQFREARIYWEEVSGGVVVTFEVFERPTIQYIHFHGNRLISDKTLLRESGLEEGEALNLYSIDEARRKLLDLYNRRSFPKAYIEILEGHESGHRGVVFDIAEGPLVRLAASVRPPFVGVEFVGNELVSDARLLAVLRGSFFDYRPGSTVDFKQIEKEVEKLTKYYRSFGYFRAEIGRIFEFDHSQKWLTLRFIIKEGPRYEIRNVAVAGHERFASEELKQMLELQAGDFYHRGRMNQDVRSLTDLYGSQGHIFADIEPQPRLLLDEPALDMVYKITEGKQFRVGNINVHIAGEYPHTRESVVLNHLSIKPGDIVDMRELRASERRLKASQLFETNPAEGRAPEIVIRPPELDEADELIAGSRGSSSRGQSPDSARGGPEGSTIGLDIYIQDRNAQHQGGVER